MFVAQVDREGCEIIFSNQWPDKIGHGMLFISLSEAACAALPSELASTGVDVKQGWWGYRLTVVADPDGNELYFPDRDDKGGG